MRCLVQPLLPLTAAQLSMPKVCVSTPKVVAMRHGPPEAAAAATLMVYTMEQVTMLHAAP